MFKILIMLNLVFLFDNSVKKYMNFIIFIVYKERLS